MIVEELKTNLKKEYAKREKDIAENLKFFRNHSPVGFEHRLLQNLSDLSSDRRVEEAIDAFLTSLKAQVITHTEKTAHKAFEDYVRGKPPFGYDKKKEFPDSLALIALDSWAEENFAKISLVSRNKDWQKYCAEGINLNCYPDLSEAIRSIEFDENSLSDQISAWIIRMREANSQQWKEINALVKDTVADTIVSHNAFSSQFLSVSYTKKTTDIELEYFSGRPLWRFQKRNAGLIHIDITLRASVFLEAEIVGSEMIEHGSSLADSSVYTWVRKKELSIPIDIKLTLSEPQDTEVIVIHEVSALSPNLHLDFGALDHQF